LVQPGDIVSKDVVDVDGSSLYPAVNGIKEVKCLICDMVAGCSIELRVLRCFDDIKKNSTGLLETKLRWDASSLHACQLKNKQLPQIASWKFYLR